MGFKHISIVLILLVFLASFAFATWDCTGVPGRVEYRFNRPTYCATFGLGTEAYQARCTHSVSRTVLNALGNPGRCNLKVYCDSYKDRGRYVVASCVKYAPVCGCRPYK